MLDELKGAACVLISMLKLVGRIKIKSMWGSVKLEEMIFDKFVWCIWWILWKISVKNWVRMEWKLKESIRISLIENFVMLEVRI